MEKNKVCNGTTLPMAKECDFMWKSNFGSARIAAIPMGRYVRVVEKANGLAMWEECECLKTRRKTLRQYFVLVNWRNNLSGFRAVGTAQRSCRTRERDGKSRGPAEVAVTIICIFIELCGFCFACEAKCILLQQIEVKIENQIFEIESLRFN